MHIAILPIGVLVLLLLLGGLVLMAALIANKNTRALGLGLAGAGVLVVLVIGSLAWFRAQTHDRALRHQHAAMEEAARGELRAKLNAQVADLQGELSQLDAGDDEARAHLQREILDLQARISKNQGPIIHLSGGGGSTRVSIAWGGIIVVLLGVLLLLGLVKAVSGATSGGALAAVLAIVVGLGLLVMVVQYFLLRASYVETQEARVSSQVATVTQAWEENTEPRITLETEEAAQAPAAETTPEAQPAADANEEIQPEADSEPTASAEAPSSGEQDSAKAAADAEPVTAEADAEDAAEPAEPAPDASEERPAWVANPPQRIGHVHKRVVQVGPCATEDDCYQRLDGALWRVAQDFVEREIAGRGVSPNDLQKMDLSPGYLRANYCTEAYVETVDTETLENLKQLYVLVEFNDAAREELQRRWDAVARREALAGVAATGAGVLGLVGLVFGLLKLDEATRGYYTKRLFIGVPAAIIGVLLLLAFANA